MGGSGGDPAGSSSCSSWAPVITAIGTWWVQLRAGVMRVLPDFPGKSRLPPYGSTE